MDRFCKSILSKGSGVVGNFKVNVAWRKKKKLAIVLRARTIVKYDRIVDSGYS